MEEKVLTINTDGGSRGNPGNSACAYVAHIDGKVIKKQSEFIGVSTNNIAEYRAVLIALRWMVAENINNSFNKIQFLIDSELVVKQLTGIYKIKNCNIQKIVIEIVKLKKEFGKPIIFRNVPREQNKLADFLVNEELDRH